MSYSQTGKLADLIDFFCFILRKHFSARLRGFSVSLIAYVGSRWQFTVHVSRLSRWRRRRRSSAARLSGAWLPIASTLHNSIRNCLSLMCVVGWKFSSWREDDHFQQWLLCKPRTSTHFSIDLTTIRWKDIKYNGLYLQHSKSSHDTVVVMKFKFCTHSARLFRKLDHVLLWSTNTGHSPNVSTTPITAMGCRQCLSLSVVPLKGKHCRKPHCHNGVVDTFGLWQCSAVSVQSKENLNDLMFCLCTLPQARPAQAKIQMLTTSSL